MLCILLGFKMGLIVVLRQLEMGEVCDNKNS